MWSRMKWYQISICFVLKCCTGWERSWWHFHYHTKEALRHKWHRNPSKFASSKQVEHNNYRQPHTPLPWTRETCNFASWNTNSPKSNQEIGTLQKWTSYPLCLPPNRNLYILQAWSLLLLGTISQSLGYEPNIKIFAWPPQGGFTSVRLEIMHIFPHSTWYPV